MLQSNRGIIEEKYHILSYDIPKEFIISSPTKPLMFDISVGVAAWKNVLVFSSFFNVENVMSCVSICLVK